MKHFMYILTAYLLLLPILSMAQENSNPVEQDSLLYAEWKDESLSVVKRLKAIHRILFLKNAPNDEEMVTKWYNEMDKAIALSREHGHEEFIPNFLTFKGVYTIMVLKDDDKACPMAEEAMDLALHYQDYQTAAFLISGFLSNYVCRDSSKYSTEKLLEILDQVENNAFKTLEEGTGQTEEELEMLYESIVNVIMARIMYHVERNEYPEALKYLQKVITFSKKVNREDLLPPHTYIMIGSIHVDIGNYAEAEKYLLKVINNPGTPNYYIGSANNELSRLYLNTNQPEKALEAAKKAIAIMEPEGDTNSGCDMCVHQSYTAEAGVYNLMGDYGKALEKLLKHKDYHEDPNSGANSYGYAFYFAELGTAYLGLKQYENAIEAANKALTYATGSSLIQARKSYEIIYKAQQALNNYKEALSSFENFVTVRDSMAVLMNAQEVTRIELENSFQQEQLERQLSYQESLNKEKARRNRTIALSIFAGLIAIFLFYRLRLVQKTKNLLKSKNEQIEEEKEKAKASERAKHMFLANMSHEIRTPMNAIKGMTDILLRRKPRKDQTEYLDSIKQSSDSLLIIINDILDISKIEAGKIELENQPFSVNEVINNVNTIMQFKAEEKGLQLKRDIPKETIMVNGDATRLPQILINLIDNAIKFTEKGEVTIILKPEQKKEKLNLHFTISDTGIGIDADQMEKIFKSFEQAYSDTSRKFGGTGLGLSISKKLIELHNGKIWVESKKGHGTEFHFAIPYDKAEAVDEKETISTSNDNVSEQLKGIQVLLVEDNTFNAIVAQEELEDAIEGVVVDLAENGAVALDKVKTSDYDIILMDIQMPIINGYEATKAIRALDKSKSEIPIIAMTANVLKDEVDSCFKAGMDDFIGKPFNTEELIQKIFQLIKK